MIGIGNTNNKPNAGAAHTVGSQELKQEFIKIVEEIKKLLGPNKDKTQIPTETKYKLRDLYNRAGDVAEKIADIVTDIEESKKFRENSKQLHEAAAGYGSARVVKLRNVTFDDVKGMENVKELVKTFKYMIEHPNIVSQYKMEAGLGMLLYGPPGTGKTMIAEAIANYLKMPLFVVSPSDIFKSYVGESEAAVKQLFKELDSCGENGVILFVDECESIFSKRTSDTKDYKAAVTNELLQRLNGFGVDGAKRILIGATNRPDHIDPAYLRTKRFSYMICVEPPNDEAKLAIIKSKLGKTPLESGLTAEDILAMTNRTGYEQTYLGEVPVQDKCYSAADLTGIVEEACRLAIEKLVAKQSEEVIPLTREMFEEAFKKIPPSLSMKMVIAYQKFREDPSLLDKYYGM